MKRKVKLLIITIVAGFSAIVSDSYGQTTQATNNRDQTSWFLGWNTSGQAGAGPLNIKNDFNRPIKFFTNTSQRAVFDSLGNFGIGTVAPLSRLHVFDNSTLVNYPFNPSTTVVSRFIAQNANASEQYAVIGESNQAAGQNTGGCEGYCQIIWRIVFKLGVWDFD